MTEGDRDRRWISVGWCALLMLGVTLSGHWMGGKEGAFMAGMLTMWLVGSVQMAVRDWRDHRDRRVNRRVAS